MNSKKNHKNIVVFTIFLAGIFALTSCSENEVTYMTDFQRTDRVCELMKTEGYLILRDLSGKIITEIPEAEQNIDVIEKDFYFKQELPTIQKFRNTYSEDGKIKQEVIERLKRHLPNTLWVNDPNLQCQNYTANAHMQGIADDQSFCGGTVIGTEGQSRRLEGFSLNSSQPDRPIIYYEADIQNIGWRGNDGKWGEFVGTRGESRQLSYIRISTGTPNVILFYKVHRYIDGWTPTVNGGAVVGNGRRIEALQLWIYRY